MVGWYDGILIRNGVSLENIVDDNSPDLNLSSLRTSPFICILMRKDVEEPTLNG